MPAVGLTYIDSSRVTGIEFEGHASVGLAVHALCRGDNRRGLARSGWAIEQQVWKVVVVNQIRDGVDDLFVGHQVL